MQFCLYGPGQIFETPSSSVSPISGVNERVVVLGESAAKGVHPVVHGNAAYWRFNGDEMFSDVVDYPQSSIVIRTCRSHYSCVNWQAWQREGGQGQIYDGLEPNPQGKLKLVNSSLKITGNKTLVLHNGFHLSRDNSDAVLTKNSSVFNFHEVKQGVYAVQLDEPMHDPILQATLDNQRSYFLGMPWQLLAGFEGPSDSPVQMGVRGKPARFPTEVTHSILKGSEQQYLFKLHQAHQNPFNNISGKCDGVFALESAIAPGFYLASYNNDHRARFVKIPNFDQAQTVSVSVARTVLWGICAI